MMIFIPILLAIAPLNDGPAAQLDPLIQSTTRLLEKQKQLKTLLENYQSLHDRYLNNMEDRTLAMQTGKAAQESLDIIKEEKMTHLFDPAYLSEMALFAKLATRPSIPKLP